MELQLKREKGLCYKCDEKFQPGNKCRLKELQVLVVQEEEGVVENEVQEVVELSLNSVVGLTTPRTMKVTGSLLGQAVVVLVDYGAIHNFISLGLVKKLNIPVTGTNSYGVTIGTGTTVEGGGICKGLVVALPGIEVVDDFLAYAGVYRPNFGNDVDLRSNTGGLGKVDDEI